MLLLGFIVLLCVNNAKGTNYHGENSLSNIIKSSPENEAKSHMEYKADLERRFLV